MPDPKGSGLSFSTVLVLLAFGVIVPALLFSGFLIYSFGAAERAHYQLRISAAAREAQAAVDRDLKGKLDTLEILAASPLLTRDTIPEFYKSASQAAEYLHSNVILFDAASRKQMLDTRVSYGTPLPDRPDPNAEQVTNSGKPIITDLLVDRLGRHLSFTIYVPAIRDGLVSAVVASGWDSKHMAGILQEDVQSADWLAWIIDRSGVILARSKDHQSAVGTRAPSGEFEAGGNGELSIARTRDLDGNLALIGFARSPVTGWVTATSVPLEIIEAPLKHSWFIFIIAGMSFLALSAAIFFLLGRYLIRPVASIVQAAARIGRGELVAPVSSGLREINVVSSALSQASIERKSAEEKVDFLMREQAHRSKNLLTVVGAIARLTARCTADFHSFQSAFSGRLHALASSNDLLINRQWAGTDPASLVRSQLAPFTELDDCRIKTEGPRVMLKPEAAEALGLSLHELATNAAKYGALSVPEGFISIAWQQDPERFSMSWSEHDGPPVAAPSSKGFGRVVIEQMAARSLSANVSLEFPPEGARWRINMPATVVLSQRVAREMTAQP
jgi:two-component sensor histidine kinase